MSEFEDLFGIEEIDYKAVATPPVKVELDSEYYTFTKDQSPYVPATDVVEKRNALSAIEEKMAGFNQRRKEIEFKIEELNREYGAKIAALREQLDVISNESFDTRRQQRQAELAVRAAENVLREAINNEKVRQTFLENSVKFDEITAGLKWREFAFEHQIEGAKLLASARRAILGDKMGLGKTLTSLIYADMLQSQKILVIVPDDVVSNFVKEIVHWAPHRTVVQIGKQTKAARDLLLGVLRTTAAFIVVVNYSSWRKDKSLLDRLVELKFDTVIMDEAHSIKSTSTAAFKGCAQIILAENSCPNCRGNIQHVHDDSDREQDYYNNRWIPRDYNVCIGNGHSMSKTQKVEDVKYQGCGWSTIVDLMAGNIREYGALRSVRNVVPMTGTVILNKPTDIFSLLHLIDDEHFHSQKDFERSFCQTNPWTNKIEFRPGGLESLTKKLAGKYIARDRKSAGVVLPKQEVIIHDIEIDKQQYADQYRVIEQLSKHAMLALSSGAKMPILATIALITRKRQANVWPAGIEFRDPLTGAILFSVGDEVHESIKLDKIITDPERSESGEWEGLIPDLTGNGDRTNGERVVVFSQFKQPLAELERRIRRAGIDVVRFDGDTPENIRNMVKADFDRKYCDEPGYEYKWQVVLANYKTGGVGLNFTGATQMIILDEEWNGGKADQAFGRIDRIGQTEETSVHILRLNRTIDTWMADLIESKRNMVEGFEANAELANDLLKGMQNGDLI